jgi:hypothetical protein
MSNNVSGVDAGSGARRTGSRSRRKGKNGELEACVALEAVLGFPWRRTAQRRGDGTADVEPVDGGRIAIHVEVKRYQGRLQWWTRRLLKSDKVHLVDQSGFLIVRLEAIRNAMLQDGDIETAPRQGCAEKWMLQAVRDAEDGLIPVVLCRQDKGCWILAWRYADDDALMAVLRRAVA